mmetsp:Transcript_21074/g.37711  ORF Transcript_21074/g.37711 Transcript_21074/m.37711 type:complete len:1057 (-) Transcript_21074:472-3642(-)
MGCGKSKVANTNETKLESDERKEQSSVDKTKEETTSNHEEMWPPPEAIPMDHVQKAAKLDAPLSSPGVQHVRIADLIGADSHDTKQQKREDPDIPYVRSPSETSISTKDQAAEDEDEDEGGTRAQPSTRVSAKRHDGVPRLKQILSNEKVPSPQKIIQYLNSYLANGDWRCKNCDAQNTSEDHAKCKQCHQPKLSTTSSFVGWLQNPLNKSYVQNMHDDGVELMRGVVDKLDYQGQRFVLVDEETVIKLATLPEPIYQIGLVDKMDKEVLQFSLYEAAGQPGCFNDEEERRLKKGKGKARAFDHMDRSTWTLENLREQSVLRMVNMQCHAGGSYRCLINTQICLHSVNSYSCNNVIPFHNNLFPVDKSGLRATESKVQFRLMDAVFQTGNEFNTRDQMALLRELLFGVQDDNLQSLGNVGTGSPSLSKSSRGDSYDDSYALTASPLNAVTLNDTARVKAGIPIEAAFYCFCHPVEDRFPNSSGSSDFYPTRGTGPHRVWEAAQRKQLNLQDPFMRWLVSGAFFYFNYLFDIVGINAISFDGNPHEDKSNAPWHSQLCLPLGESCALPSSAIQPLQGLQRWVQVTDRRMRGVFGFSHMAYITPSEFIGDHIFPKNGGFAFLHESEKDFLVGHGGSNNASRFFGVVRNDDCLERVKVDAADPKQKVSKLSLSSLLPDCDIKDGEVIQMIRNMQVERAHNHAVPLLYDTPLHIAQLGCQKVLTSYRGGVKGMRLQKSAPNSASATRSSGPSMLFVGSGVLAAEGLAAALGYKQEMDLLQSVASKIGLSNPRWTEQERLKIIQCENEAITEEVIRKLLDKQCIWLHEDETCTGYAKQVQWNSDYVHNQQATEELVGSNNGGQVVRDPDRTGRRLIDFMKEPECITGRLDMAHVAALRIYTSSTFRLINGPLRQVAAGPIGQNERHPLAFTTLCISDALKKLRACHMGKKDFMTTYLWRGMRDRTVMTDFLQRGGTELACMSTTRTVAVAASYAKSDFPLLFRIKVDSPMELGADIRWLSMYPNEAEVLYPPLTFIKPLFQQPIKDCKGGVVVTVKPSFPT